MSTPTPGALTTGPRVSILRRKLRPNETFEDVMDFAPQVSRPFLMATVKESDDRCVQLNNGLLVTWNGVIVDPTQNPTDPYEWYISEPYRRLDSTIVYADGWERKNNGSFVAQSGLTIDKELTLVHRNGHTVFQDGTTVAPSGKMFQGQANSVGIIYRPGVSNILGIQHLPMQEQEMDDEFRYAIMPVKFDGAISKRSL